ncbi:MAG: C25 family cysteine peptidase [Bacteroidota bacterium]
MLPIKLIVTSKKTLEFKYGTNFSKIEAAIKRMQRADKIKRLDTKLVYIDDAASCKSAGIKKLKLLSEQECKRVVDDLYKKHTPAYIVLLGAGDVIPFQEILNPAEDDDKYVLSDLPYACEPGYNNLIDAFTGPTRVVGRIPDMPGKQKNAAFLLTVIRNAINHKSLTEAQYHKYFAVTAQVWKKSTEISLQSMFADHSKMLSSPLKMENIAAKYSKSQLKPLTHFYNCHGAKTDPEYYGQRGRSYPSALASSNLANNISPGTIVAAECCYGAELYDASVLQPAAPAICHTYLQNGAVAFVGSSSIAYGPADSNALADLITQYFIKSVLKGDVSTGRGFLEARQRFLTDSGPQLDPYELKTLAQFYLLGDPSIVPVLPPAPVTNKSVPGTTIYNTRAALSTKGIGLQQTIEPSKKQTKRQSARSDNKVFNALLKETSFENAGKELVYSIDTKHSGKGTQKMVTGENARYRTFIKEGQTEDIINIKVLVVKEDAEQVLGWRVYESR